MEAIEAFWTWWTDEGRAALTDAIRSGAATDLPDTITRLVHAIHPELQWQLTPGQTADHALIVSPDGNPELRGVTEVWLRTGPDSDEAWEFHAARQPVPGRVEVAGLDIDPREVQFTFEFDELYEQLDVVLDHDDLADASAEAALEAGFAAIEAVIGEDQVERWLGLVDISDQALRGRSLADLPDIIRRFEPQLTGDQWEEVETTDVSGWEEHLVINRALKSIDHLSHPIHLEIRIEALEYDRTALPTEGELAELERLRDELDSILAGHALPLAVDTVNRRQSLHFFVDDIETIEPTVDAWIAQHPDRTIEAMFMIDPGWNNAHRWD